MLSELKFVQGAVAKKDFLPALTHFKIEGGTVRSFNGTLALSCPIELDIECCPKADPFVKAIQNCNETVSMKLTPTGRLSIKSGSFKAFIECVSDETPHVTPEGEEFEIDGEALISAFKHVLPFVGDDASRPWSNGVLVKGCSAFATNNVSLIEYWVGSEFPLVCNIPRVAIKELVRISEAPIKAQVDSKSITFHYTDGRWIRSALYETDGWPDLAKVLNVPSNPQPLDESIYEALDTLKPFVDRLERIYISKGEFSTTLVEGEGASFHIPDFIHEGVYQLKILNLIKGVANTIDFSLYPKPCLFFGDRLRGAIIGMRA